MCQIWTVSSTTPLQNQGDERSLALLDSTPPATPRALRLDRMTLTHPGALLDDPREFRRYGRASPLLWKQTDQWERFVLSVELRQRNKQRKQNAGYIKTVQFEM